MKLYQNNDVSKVKSFYVTNRQEALAEIIISESDHYHG